jgi:hypothetical protein
VTREEVEILDRLAEQEVRRRRTVVGPVAMADPGTTKIGECHHRDAIVPSWIRDVEESNDRVVQFLHSDGVLFGLPAMTTEIVEASGEHTEPEVRIDQAGCDFEASHDAGLREFLRNVRSDRLRNAELFDQCTRNLLLPERTCAQIRRANRLIHPEVALVGAATEARRPAGIAAARLDGPIMCSGSKYPTFAAANRSFDPLRCPSSQRVEETGASRVRAPRHG